MNSEELKELLDYIQENNSWEKMCTCIDRDRYCFKYIRISYDTRRPSLGEHVWHIILDNGKDSKIYLRDKTLKECKDILDLPRKEIMKLFEKDNEISQLNAYKLIEAPYMADLLDQKRYYDFMQHLKQSELEMVNKIIELVDKVNELSGQSKHNEPIKLSELKMMIQNHTI